jgi:molecular chaperone DnaK (HSP70)
MNARAFAALPDKHDERYYILGLDLGSSYSALAFYNRGSNSAETIDLSGGYGKPHVPTAVQYSADTREWTFGTYALLSDGEINLFSRLGRFDYVEIAGRNRSVAHMLAMFVKDLIGNVRQINPRAVVAGIVCSIPSYFPEEAREELLRVFKLAGYEKELIALVGERECMLAHTGGAGGRTLVLDIGAAQIRGGIYDAQHAIAGMFTEGLAQLQGDTAQLLAMPLGGAPAPAEFVLENRDVLFQKQIRSKPAKLYYNFLHPPLVHEIPHAQVEEIARPYAARLREFIAALLQKNLTGTPIDAASIDSVLVTGGGTEMLWARDVIAEFFPAARIRITQKTATAEGAAIIAAARLGLIPDTPLVTDRHQLPADIGIAQGDEFITLIAQGGFWWQAHAPIYLTINKEVTGEPIQLQIAQRGADGVRQLQTISLQGLPPRIKGTTRLVLIAEFASERAFTLRIQDAGFGDISPASQWQTQFNITAFYSPE